LNPAPYSGREIDNRGIHRWIALVSLVLTVGALLTAWILVRPQPAGANGLWVMIIWMAAILIAVVGIFLGFWISPERGRYINYLQRNVAVIMLTSVLIMALGTAAAFLSGDKFDAVRAAAISFALIAISYPRQRYWRRADR
jgi:hypothetical protein